jgi:hypothetical protein
VRWYAIIEVKKSDGSMVELDDGELCYLCGNSLDVFCLESKDDLIRKYVRSEDGWREKINLVRAGFEACVFKQFKEQRVSGSKKIALRVSLIAAFITVAAFEAHFGIVITKVNLPVVKLWGPEGRWLEGILTQLHGLPEDLAHYRVELLSEQSNTFEHLLVPFDKVVAVNQCRHRFQFANQQTVGKRHSSIRGDKALHLDTFKDVTAEIKKAKKNIAGKCEATGGSAGSWRRKHSSGRAQRSATG